MTLIRRAPWYRLGTGFPSPRSGPASRGGRGPDRPGEGGIDQSRVPEISRSKLAIRRASSAFSTSSEAILRSRLASSCARDDASYPVTPEPS
jgi:hypothetical protein